MSGVGAANGIENIIAALVHVVIGTDADGFNELLRPNNMFQGQPKLFRQPAMRYQH
jgi:hypothetical protein